MEKKRLMEHWNISLAGMKQRDEAYVVTQELLRYSRTPGPEGTSGLGRRDSRRDSRRGFQCGSCVGRVCQAEKVSCSKLHNKFKG